MKHSGCSKLFHNIDIGSNREDTGNQSTSKLEEILQDSKEFFSHLNSSSYSRYQTLYTAMGMRLSSSLSLSSSSIQPLCSSYCHSHTICTCYTFSSFCGLWPISSNPAIIQTSGHFPLRLQLAQLRPHHAKYLSSIIYEAGCFLELYFICLERCCRTLHIIALRTAVGLCQYAQYKDVKQSFIGLICSNTP